MNMRPPNVRWHVRTFRERNVEALRGPAATTDTDDDDSAVVP